MAIRVAFIRYNYDPFGGAERFTDSVMRGLAERGIEVHIFARKWAGASSFRVIPHLIGGPEWPSLLRHATFAHLVCRAVGKERFDLIHSNERTLCQDVYRAGDGVHAQWLQLRYNHSSRLKKLSIRLNPFHHYLCRLERLLFEDPRLKAVIVNSHMVRNEILSRFRIHQDSIHVIYNGVDLKRFHPRHRENIGEHFRKLNGVTESTSVILLVGSGFERKGVEPLMRAVAASRGDSLLWIVGKGRKDRYEKTAGELGIRELTRFFGPREDVVPFFSAADIFALPTVYDPFPTAVLEAMASGLPVITTAQCGAAEIIKEGNNGFVVKSPRDVDGIARGLARLFSHEVREFMSKEARRCAEGFPMERTLTEIEGLYRRLLSLPQDAFP